MRLGRAFSQADAPRLVTGAPKTNMDTADRILDSAEALIQERGFFGFSFQDIAEQIGIKKASIYYHFPAKAQLGRAVIDRYRKRMRQVSDAVDANDGIDHWEALALYIEPILQIGRNPETACLCGVLGGEYMALPDDMKSEIADFFDEHLVWLARLLTTGREAGAFRFVGEPEAVAKFLFGAMEGGLLIKRTNGDTKFLDEVVDVAMSVLGHKG